MTDALPSDSKARKDIPMARGLLDYFPAALAEVAKVSKAGNDKHNPGEEMHHARGKSNDHADCIARHLIDRGNVDPDDNQRHSAKLAWRALALLQEELEAAGAPLARGAKLPDTGLVALNAEINHVHACKNPHHAGPNAQTPNDYGCVCTCGARGRDGLEFQEAGQVQAWVKGAREPVPGPLFTPCQLQCGMWEGGHSWQRHDGPESTCYYRGCGVSRAAWEQADFGEPSVLVAKTSHCPLTSQW